MNHRSFILLGGGRDVSSIYVQRLWVAAFFLVLALLAITTQVHATGMHFEQRPLKIAKYGNFFVGGMHNEDWGGPRRLDHGSTFLSGIFCIRSADVA